MMTSTTVIPMFDENFSVQLHPSGVYVMSPTAELEQQQMHELHAR
jgi:hypothetical protein